MMFASFKNKLFKPKISGVQEKSPHKARPGFRFFWLWAPFSFVVVFIFSISYISLTVSTIEQDVSTIHLEVAKHAASVITSSLDNLIEAQSNLSFEISDSSRDKETVLALFMRENTEFEKVALVSLEGETLLANDRYTVLDKSEFRSYTGQDNFLEAMKGNRSRGLVFISSRGEPVMTISTPVISLTGQVEGMLVADLNLKFMWKLMQDMQIGHMGKVYVVGQSGNVIADPDASIVLQGVNLFSRQIVQDILTGAQSIDGLDPVLRYANSNGEQVFSAGFRIDPYGWGVITEEPLSEALVASQRTKVAGIVFSVGIALMLSILMVMIQRLIISNKRASDINTRLDMSVLLLTKREKELTVANEQLRELDKAKSEFISIAAHQLRTPLSAIKWTLSLIIDDESKNLTAEQQSLIMKGYESNERIIRLVNDMLMVTRIESGKVQYNLSPFHVEDLIESVILDFAGIAHARKIKLSFEKSSTQLPYVNADAEKIRGVLQNLIENSMHYTKDGGRVALKAALENDMVKVMVEDNGIGIPLNQQASVFNKFFRADNAMKMQTDGSGLGLFVIKNIVEKHGGRIGFVSDGKKGSLFYFTLPGTPVTI